MKRWRIPDGSVLAEPPPGSKTLRYYQLGRDGAIQRTYDWNQCSQQEQLGTLDYIVSGSHLVCHHTIEVGPRSETTERVELPGLVELGPEESPTEADVLRAIAARDAARQTAQRVREASIAQLVSAADQEVRDVVPGLAARIVDHKDRVAASLIAMLNALALQWRAAEPATVSWRVALDMASFAALRIAPTRRRRLPDEAERRLAEELRSLAKDLTKQASFQDDIGDSIVSREGNDYRAAADLLNAAAKVLETVFWT